MTFRPYPTRGSRDRRYQAPQHQGRESALVTACLQLLRLRGIYSWRQNNAAVWDAKRGRFRAGSATKGVSDILGCVDGKLLCVECKTVKGRLSADQKAFLAAVEAAGGLAWVVRDVSELDAKLKEIGR